MGTQEALEALQWRDVQWLPWHWAARVPEDTGAAAQCIAAQLRDCTLSCAALWGLGSEADAERLESAL
eukprot:6875311-Lingulodinium_polyedra.AAC.1